MERDLAKAATGFFSKDDYKRKREELEQDKAVLALKKASGEKKMPSSEGGEGGVPSGEGGAKVKKEKKKDKKKAPTALSFGDDLDAEGEASPSMFGKKLGKCEDVDVSFLQKNDREKQVEAEQQEKAMRELIAQQRLRKEQQLTLTYTFRSAVTQRELPIGLLKGSVQVKLGFTAEEVAVAVRTDVEKLGGKFRPAEVQGIKEERDVTLICCCAGAPHGSFIIPGAVNLVELTMRKWSDTNTPVFDEFTHGIIVTERRYLEAQYAQRLLEMAAARNSCMLPSKHAPPSMHSPTLPIVPSAPRLSLPTGSTLSPSHIGACTRRAMFTISRISSRTATRLSTRWIRFARPPARSDEEAHTSAASTSRAWYVRSLSRLVCRRAVWHRAPERVTWRV